MKSRLAKWIFINLLLASYLLLTYNTFGGWWNSSAGTILIVFFAYLTWNTDFLRQIGLNMNLVTIARSLLAVSFFTICSLAIMSYIARRNGILIRYTGWYNVYHDVFYILNEEIVLGAYILFSLTRRRGMNPMTASVLLALFFSIIHYFFYRWIFDAKGIISITALSTLFLVGIIRNCLILRTGHIGYSWALHFGWMVIMFGMVHVRTGTNEVISEPDRFNLYLGSAEMFSLTLVLVIAGLLFQLRKRSWKWNGLFR